MCPPIEALFFGGSDVTPYIVLCNTWCLHAIAYSTRGDLGVLRAPKSMVRTSVSDFCMPEPIALKNQSSHLGVLRVPKGMVRTSAFQRLISKLDACPACVSRSA